jgi:hypothetical protein
MKQKTMTRAQAERLVATTDDEEVLSTLLGHPNQHVRSKVLFKRLAPEDRRAATAIKYFAVILQNLSAPMPAPSTPPVVENEAAS